MTTSWLHVKNWEKFQHYKTRGGAAPKSMPWIKLHERLLDDPEFAALSESNRHRLIMIWLVASKHDGKIPFDNALIARRIGVRRLDLSLFVERGFLLRGSNTGNDDPRF